MWAKEALRRRVSDLGRIHHQGRKGRRAPTRIYADEEDPPSGRCTASVTIAHHHGARKCVPLRRAAALKWENVNLENRTLLIAAKEVGARKTKKARSIPISDRLAAVLEMRQATGGR